MKSLLSLTKLKTSLHGARRLDIGVLEDFTVRKLSSYRG